MATMTKLDRARERVLKALQDWVASPTLEAKKAAADAIVDFRSLHTFEGRPDWAGKSPEYRLAIELLYRKAEVKSDSQGGGQAGLRNHIGNAVRAKAPAEDLIALGLDPDGPSERSRKARLAKRRDEGRPERARAGHNHDGNHALATLAPTTSSVLVLLTHAQQDLKLAEAIESADIDHVAVLAVARTLLDEVVKYVGDVARNV